MLVLVEADWRMKEEHPDEELVANRLRAPRENRKNKHFWHSSPPVKPIRIIMKGRKQPKKRSFTGDFYR